MLVLSPKLMSAGCLFRALPWTRVGTPDYIVGLVKFMKICLVPLGITCWISKMVKGSSCFLDVLFVFPLLMLMGASKCRPQSLLPLHPNTECPPSLYHKIASHLTPDPWSYSMLTFLIGTYGHIWITSGCLLPHLSVFPVPSFLCSRQRQSVKGPPFRITVWSATQILTLSPPLSCSHGLTSVP